MPSPIRRQFVRFARDAAANVGYHASGTLTSRSSVNRTASRSRVNRRSMAVGSLGFVALLTMSFPVFVPSVENCILVLGEQPFLISQFTSIKAVGRGAF